MSRRYRVFQTPPEILAGLPYRLYSPGREYWSFETASRTYHGFYSKAQAEAVAKQLIIKLVHAFA